MLNKDYIMDMLMGVNDNSFGLNIQTGIVLSTLTILFLFGLHMSKKSKSVEHKFNMYDGRLIVKRDHETQKVKDVCGDVTILLQEFEEYNELSEKRKEKVTKKYIKLIEKKYHQDYSMMLDNLKADLMRCM